MKNRIFLSLAILMLCIFSGCEKDNYNEPSSELSGNIVYQNENIGVKSGGTQLELWEEGYALNTKIPVDIAQDGTFKALLFNGNYKIVRLSGAPWENQPNDTIRVSVKGNTAVDIPVVPYFIVKNVSYNKTGSTITAKFTIDKTSESSVTIDRAQFFVGRGLFLDDTNNENNPVAEGEEDKSIIIGSSITLGSETSITVNIPANLASAEYLFARVAVKTSGVGQLLYSVSEKIQLK